RPSARGRWTRRRRASSSSLLDVPSGRPGRFRTILHALLSLPLGVLSFLAATYGWGIVVLNLFYPARWLIGMGGSLKDAWGGPTLAGAWAVHATGGLVMLLLMPALMKGITTLQARLMVRVLGRADGTMVR
ncbi:sensor domain-containing protein, partial [Actinomadura sp. NPDC048032]|uniref:sensor domain-containing protein n=1 Tax=Actinomadura sp. NPDC048032 TaxID=3155747 RepID=UPI0033C576E8